jgi:tetratricopeptide repeat protein 21B
VAYQKTMLGDYAGAYATYQKSSQLDETNTVPLFGMIYCRVKQDLLDDAEQQLEFLNEIGESAAKTADHVYLEAIIEWRKRGNRDQAIRLLDQALNLHISATKSASGNLEFYIKLNADFLMELAQEYLVHCGSKPIAGGGQPPKYLVKAIKLLENVTKQNCGLTDAQLLLAKAKWLANDTNAALRELYNCLQKDPTMIEAHVLAALINCESGNIKAAENSLQQAFA